MKRLRQVHLLIGCLLAPMLLLLAVSGGLQVFRLHESKKDGSYHAPAAFSFIGKLHMNEYFRVPREALSECDKLAPAEVETCRARVQAEKTRVRRIELVHSWVLVLGGVALAVNTATGVWMALSMRKWRGTVLALLAIGLAAPVVLVVLF